MFWGPPAVPDHLQLRKRRPLPRKLPLHKPGDCLPLGAGGPGGASNFVSIDPAYKDLAYAAVSDAQKLDLYLPTTGSGPFPLVVMIHGGGFMFGDKTDGSEHAGVDQLVDAGYAVASINYRLSGEATYPAQINDAKAAVRFPARKRCELQSQSRSVCCLWCFCGWKSCPSLLGTTCGVAELEGAGSGNADQSSCVQATVDWFGPIDFLKMDEQFADSCPANHNDASSPESKLVGAPIQTVPDLVATTNPQNYITADDGPFLIENGTDDCNIPPVQNKKFADALSKVIGADKVQYVSIEGAGHGGSQFETAENLQLVVDFLNKYLK